MEGEEEEPITPEPSMPLRYDTVGMERPDLKDPFKVVIPPPVRIPMMDRMNE